MREPARRIDFLDYVRGIAVLSVFLFHALGPSYGTGSLQWNCLFRDFRVPLGFDLLLPFHMGWMGVPIFFVVSGFCIHVSFQQQGREWGIFFLRRFFRLYPAYLAALVLCIVLNTAGTRNLVFQFVTHALLIHNYSAQAYYGINSSFWTIAIEVQLYLLYPLLLLLVNRFGWKTALIVVAACECLINGWETVYEVMLGVSAYDYPYVFHQLQPYFKYVDTRTLAYLTVSPLTYWFSWSLGAFAADAYLKNRPLPFTKFSPLFWGVLVVAAYLARPLASFFFLFVALLTVTIICQHLSRTREASADRPHGFWLEHLRRVGIYSYSIYLLHQPLLDLWGRGVSYVFPGMPPFAKFFCCVAFWPLMMLAAAVWYRLIERPGVQLGKRLIQKMAAKKVPSNPPAPPEEKSGAPSRLTV